MTLRELGQRHGVAITKQRIDALRKRQRSLSAKLGAARRKGLKQQAEGILATLSHVKDAIKAHQQWLGEGKV